MIIDERMVTYINSLDTGHTPFLENLERTAKQDRVPIIRREMQSFLKVFLKMKQPKRILEVGTAVGFSAVFMAQYGEPDAEITTIENYEKRIPIARENFEKSGFADRITLIPGDAAEVLKPWTAHTILSLWTPLRDSTSTSCRKSCVSLIRTAY